MNFLDGRRAEEPTVYVKDIEESAPFKFFRSLREVCRIDRLYTFDFYKIKTNSFGTHFSHVYLNAYLENTHIHILYTYIQGV